MFVKFALVRIYIVSVHRKGEQYVFFTKPKPAIKSVISSTAFVGEIHDKAAT